ncbi:hypothetical protein ACHAXS_004762 [Conticribra weissflogii]
MKGKGPNQSVPGKIIIHDRNRVQSEVLPTYFNHASFASLRRQLSYFSFVRVGKGRQGGVTYTNENVYEMSDILKLKRRTTGGAASASAPSAAAAAAAAAATGAAGNKQQTTSPKRDLQDQNQQVPEQHRDPQQLRETTQDVASAVCNGIFHAAKTNRDVVQSPGMSPSPNNNINNDSNNDNNKNVANNKTPSCTSLSPGSICPTATTTATSQSSVAPSGGFLGNDVSFASGKVSGDIPRDITQNSNNTLGNTNIERRTFKKLTSTKKNKGNTTTTTTTATSSTNTTMMTTSSSSSSSRKSQKLSSRKRTKRRSNSQRNCNNLRLDRLMHVNNNIVPFIHLPARKIHKSQSLTDLIVEVDQTSDPSGSDIMHHHQQQQEESQPTTKKARREEPLAFAASATVALPMKHFHEDFMEHPYHYPAQDHAQEVNKVSPAIHALLSLGDVKHHHEFGTAFGVAAAAAVGGASNIGFSTFL